MTQLCYFLSPIGHTERDEGNESKVECILLKKPHWVKLWVNVNMVFIVVWVWEKTLRLLRHSGALGLVTADATIIAALLAVNGKQNEHTHPMGTLTTASCGYERKDSINLCHLHKQTTDKRQQTYSSTGEPVICTQPQLQMKQVDMSTPHAGCSGSWEWHCTWIDLTYQ